MPNEIEAPKVKKPTLRSLVLAYIALYDNPTSDGVELMEAFSDVRVAARPKAKKEKPAKIAKAKKESKSYDSMISDVPGTFERVMAYFVTKEGRTELGVCQEPVIVQQSVISLIKAQGAALS